MAYTPNFALPLLFAAQAQKEITHNEALVVVDALLPGCIEAIASDPALLDPEAGMVWIVGPSPLGAWVDRTAQIAIFTTGGWRFAPAVHGMRMFDRSAGTVRTYDGTAWPAPPAVADASGGVTIDIEARATLAALLSILRLHGLLDAT